MRNRWTESLGKKVVARWEEAIVLKKWRDCMLEGRGEAAVRGRV